VGKKAESEASIPELILNKGVGAFYHPFLFKMHVSVLNNSQEHFRGNFDRLGW
jgi:hypothetical protein